MKTTLAAAAVALATLAGFTGSSQAAVKIGVLTCEVDGGEGFIFGSTKGLSCAFTPADGSREHERYSGVISKFGVDLGATKGGAITWAVLAASFDDYTQGALTGDYIGANAEVSAAVGGGANVLVGPSLRTFTLQPVSVQTQTGLNIAAGIAGMQLLPATK